MNWLQFMCKNMILPKPGNESITGLLAYYITHTSPGVHNLFHR